MMRVIDLLHRWGGGVFGLILAVLGLSGALLAHRDELVFLPHVSDGRAGDPAVLAGLAGQFLTGAKGGTSLIYASDRFGLVQVRQPDGGGLYASQSGEVVARWADMWERPELFVFDLHHHLLAGDAGETVAGLAGLAGVLFVITGAVLWWRTRRTFRLRLWPARWSRPAILMHHRDLGIVMAPLLLLLTLTGAMMLFRPVAGAVLAPWTSAAEIDAALKAPKLASGPLAARPDWPAMLAEAQRRFPDAQLRIVSLPRKAGEPIGLRLKRADEWSPNGRTMLWFDAADGRLLAQRDALAMPAGVRAFNAVYPLHAAKVGRLPWRLAITAGGLAMAMLGFFAVYTFWFRRPRPARG